MWRIIIFAALGILIGHRARSERGVALMSLLFGLLYGGGAVISAAAIQDTPSLGRALFLLGMGLVMAAPVYATAEIWRRTRIQAMAWLRRLIGW